MTRKQNLIIDLIIADVTGCEYLDCETVRANISKDIIQDVVDTFEKFSYEVAKGVFENEYSEVRQEIDGKLMNKYFR